MSSNIDDGGPAFPRTGMVSMDHQYFDHGDVGMSLRDWFAGQALIGFASRSGSILAPDNPVKEAYALADAMLAERAKR